MHTRLFALGTLRSLSQGASWIALTLMGTLLGCGDGSESPVAPTRESPPTAASTAAALAFRQLTLGDDNTCGVTTDNRGYCWGYNSGGELGDGTSNNRPLPVAVAGGLDFKQMSAGTSHTCGVTTANRAYCWGSNNEGQLGDGDMPGKVQHVPEHELEFTEEMRGRAT